MDTLNLFLTVFNDWTSGGNIHVLDFRVVAGDTALTFGATFLGIGLELGVELGEWRGHG